MNKKNIFRISGKIVDIHEKKIFNGTISISRGVITGIERTGSVPDVYLMPGLTDAHIHIESSMVTPGAFAGVAVKHGTTAVVSDPHEIANVLGPDGIMFMIDDSKKVPLKFYFGAPSCVPATAYETNGAVIGADVVSKLLKRPEIYYLSEMMNYPGVIFNDPEVHKKLEAAKHAGKPVDGHAPGLTGDSLKKYIQSGISTDHECSSLEEALEKIGYNMKIIIREGSAARNLDALKELIRIHPGMVMLCSDDLHPEMLKVRHINKLIAKLILEGYDLFDVIRCATLNPAEHYNLKTGLLRIGDPADIIVVDELTKMNVLETWIEGKKVFGNGKTLFEYIPEPPLNKFNCSPVRPQDILVSSGGKNCRVIIAKEGELLTEEFITSEISGDILKIVVKDRYNDAPPAVAFISGFGLKRGAFASSIAHDSHNIICVGTNDADIINALNRIIEIQGGLAVSHSGTTKSLQLNIAGIMSTRPCEEIAGDYERLSTMVKSFGCPMKAPFMTLSFMALLVIPELKLSDKGLFDVRKFGFVPLFM